MRLSRLFVVLAVAFGGLIGMAATPAQAASGPWRQVSAGGSHTCAINTSNSLYCWGENGLAQVGDGTITTPRLTLRRVGAIGVWSSVSAGEYHTCGITTGKNLYCWGRNDLGQIGTGASGEPRLTPFRVGGAGVWSRVTTGGYHTCGITTGKNLYCWGRNDQGQVGDGTQSTPRLALHRVGAAGVWNAVSAGSSHTCGITTGKNLYCWGFNMFAQVGDGGAQAPRLSLHRLGATGVWSSVSAGSFHTCGITTGKNLYCWGYNIYGQVGDGLAQNPRLSLYRVGAAGVWSSSTALGDHTCGITSARNLYCWGHNNFGQTGDGTTNDPRLTLARVGAAGVWTGASAGDNHTCGITAAQNLYCWGYNQYGQAGIGNTSSPKLLLAPRVE